MHRPSASGARRTVDAFRVPALERATFEFLSPIMSDTGFPHAFNYTEFNGAH